MPRASIVVLCALLGACTGTMPEIRPSSSGFVDGSAVLSPLVDGKRDLAANRNGLAIRRFGEELGRNPRSLEALNGTAIAYARLGRYDVAQTYFERALEIDSRDAATLNNYGRALVDQGRLRDAQPFLEQALRHAGEDDVPVIAGNMLRVRQAPPPELLVALQDTDSSEPGPKLVRVAADRYHLKTDIAPAGGTVDEMSMAVRDVPIEIVSLPAPKPEYQPRPVALIADPPRPRSKPALPWPVQAVALADPIVAAGGSAPVATAPDELASIRQEIEQRMAGTGFGDVLDGIFAPPATFDAPQTTDGVWT